MTESGGSGRTKRLLAGAAACLVGIPVFALLHNLFDALSGMTSDFVMLSGFLGFLDAACFLAALILCPAGAAICLVVALLDRLTSGWKTVPRRRVFFLVPTVAAAAAVAYLGTSLRLSTRESDEAAGFNGSFEVVKSGYPANWNVYHRPLDAGDAELSFDPAEPIDGTQSLKMLVHRVDPSGGWRSPGLFQVTEAQTGHSYRVSFWLKNHGSRIRLVIDSETADSREPRNPIREIIDAESTDDTWREFVYTYTVPAHYSNIRFELNVMAPGTVWVDDVRIEPLSGE